jgi:hypothetical protein
VLHVFHTPTALLIKLRMTDINLFDADAWDDSALVASWDEAAEEYNVGYFLVKYCEISEHQLIALSRNITASKRVARRSRMS